MQKDIVTTYTTRTFGGNIVEKHKLHQRISIVATPSRRFRVCSSNILETKCDVHGRSVIYTDQKDMCIPKKTLESARAFFDEVKDGKVVAINSRYYDTQGREVSNG